MKAENIATLERHIRHWHMLKYTGSLNVPYHIRKEIHQVWREEANPKHDESLYCGQCVANMLKMIYTHYEKTVPNAITESVLEQKTTYNLKTHANTYANDKNIQPPAKPNKSPRHKGRKVS
ncbi:MAG: hypothetical protein EOP04_06975 [Proteobacteria bacterium]|nr:MAG: hypothetical protein EOP04_06975 [Pseudomonadota bacterium]